MRHLFIFFVLLVACTVNGKLPNGREVLRISVFYDDSYSHIEDITTYTTEIINRQLHMLGAFEFETILNKVDNKNSYHLSKLRKYMLFNYNFE